MHAAARDKAAQREKELQASREELRAKDARIKQLEGMLAEAQQPSNL
jgi:hypothetical protein